MRVLILNPPSPESFYINRDQMGGMGQKISFGRNMKSKLLSALKSEFIHSPVMQLVYSAMILRKEHEVRVIDAINEDKSFSDISPEIERFQPDYVFMAVSSSGIMFERDFVAKRIKEMVPHAKIITIGNATVYLPDLMRQPFDIAIVGEGEKKVEDICKGRDLSKIRGIMYRKGGKIRTNKQCPFLTSRELEELPFPDWKMFPYKQYRYYPLLLKKTVAPLLSSRGCPFGCYYCPYSKNMGREWRARSAGNIVKEIEHDVDNYGFEGLLFRDPLFALDKKRVEEISRLIRERNIDINWICETKPDLLTKDLLDKMHGSGCRAIDMGVESVTPEVLKGVGRNPVDLNRIKEIIWHAEKIGIRTTCFFIFGLPGSTRKTIQRTIDFVNELNPSHAEFKVATPFPGTRLYEQAVRNNWIVSEEYHKLGGYASTMQISEELTPEYLDRVSGKAFENFYFRKKWIFKEIRDGSIKPKFLMMAKSFGKAVGKLI